MNNYNSHEAHGTDPLTEFVNQGGVIPKDVELAFAVIWDPKLVSREDYDALIGSIRNLVEVFAKQNGLDAELVKACSQTFECNKITGEIKKV